MRVGRKIKSLAFTILELMVVVAIITVLAALLVPALSSAKENANKAKCLSNLRQVGIAIEFYKDDNDQYYPIAPAKNSGGWAYFNKNVFMDIIASNYFKSNYGVFRCPANNNNLQEIITRTNATGARMDYEMNSGCFGMNVNGTNGYNYPPGERIYLPAVHNVFFDFPPPNYWAGIGGSQATADMPHNADGCNVYYTDGHAGWISMIESQSSVDGRTPHFVWGRR